MDYSCQLKQQAPQPVLSVRTHTPVGQLPQFLGGAYGAIAQYLGDVKEQPAGPPFAAYYNSDMENLEVEAGFPVNRALPGRGEVQPGEIPGGSFATCLHVGPYDECRAAYEALTRWIDENGYQPAGVSYEFYLNDPSATPPQELKTEVVFPLRAQS